MSDEKNKVKTRSGSRYITVLSVLSCFAVIVLHVNGCFWEFSRDSYWISANALECLAYFAVPVFFMISGANLMDYRERYSDKVYAEKRFWRTVFPFIIWSLIGVAWDRIAHHNPLDTPFLIFSKILNVNYVNIYWFFPCLFAVYLAIPFIAYIPKEVRKKAFGYGIIAAVIMNGILPLVFELGGTYYNSNLNMPAVTGYLGWTLIGYWINNYEISKSWRRVIYLAGLAGLAAHFFGTWYLSYNAGEIVSTWKGYNRIPCVLYSTAIFVFFKYRNDTKLMTKMEKLVKPLAGTTLGVYLIHWFLLEAMKRYLPFSTTNIWYRIFGSVLLFLFCVFVVWVMKKIPLLRKIVP